eukprot:8904871-Pyramimonas_sp.AAC.1
MVFTPDGGEDARPAEVETYHFFTVLGAAALPDARVAIDAVEMEEGGKRASVTVSADKTAAYVTLETKGAALAGERDFC